MAKKRRARRMPCVPKSVRDRYERCVKHVKKQQAFMKTARGRKTHRAHSKMGRKLKKANPWAVCQKSVVMPYKAKSRAYKKCMARRKG